jgi:hypothetical protein
MKDYLEEEIGCTVFYKKQYFEMGGKQFFWLMEMVWDQEIKDIKE